MELLLSIVPLITLVFCIWGVRLLIKRSKRSAIGGPNGSRKTTKTVLITLAVVFIGMLVLSAIVTTITEEAPKKETVQTEVSWQDKDNWTQGYSYFQVVFKEQIKGQFGSAVKCTFLGLSEAGHLRTGQDYEIATTVTIQDGNGATLAYWKLLINMTKTGPVNTEWEITRVDRIGL